MKCYRSSVRLNMLFGHGAFRGGLRACLGVEARGGRKISDQDNVTALLKAWANGDREAEESLFAIVYPRLHRLASSKLRAEPRGRALDTTELVNEVYVRLASQKLVDWRCRAQFFAISATAIRRILVDRARHLRRDKRGGDAIHVVADDADLVSMPPTLDFLDLDDALVDLAAIRSTASRIVELRFFAGLSVDETAEVLGVGRASVVRQWRFARAWLGRRLAVAT